MLLGDARKKLPSSKNILAFIENNSSSEKKDYSRAVIKTLPQFPTSKIFVLSNNRTYSVSLSLLSRESCSRDSLSLSITQAIAYHNVL